MHSNTAAAETSESTVAKVEMIIIIKVYLMDIVKKKSRMFSKSSASDLLYDGQG